MVVKITVGPPVLTIDKGNTFMVTDRDGEIDPLKAQGVFAEDTRFVSSYHFLINGQRWERVTSAEVAYYSAELFLLNPLLPSYLGPPAVPDGVLGLTILRVIDEGVRETFELVNYGMDKVDAVLELEIMSDFADIFEVKTNHLRQRENIVTEWHDKRAQLVTTYENDGFLRRFTYDIVDSGHPPSFANGRLVFPIHLDPGKTWQACGHMILQHGKTVRRPRMACQNVVVEDRRAERVHQRWLDTCTTIDTPGCNVSQTYRQSVHDMGALRLYERDLGLDVWVPAAGVPWYVTLFGRDSLISSLQNMIVHARFSEGALRILGEYQAHVRDDWRDAQPGKIMHEIRHGELAFFHNIPHTPYYGTWDATPLYLMVLHQAWRWLGDRKLIQDLLGVAEGCLKWIDECGDVDGDGFQEYKTYSPQGYPNMSWKDGADSVVYEDGTQVQQPKATCELQGYVYAGKLGMAEIYDTFGHQDRARELRAQAAGLKECFNRTFWMEEEGTYAFGLDPDKRQIKSVVSNAGHCLWTGIADEAKAKRVAERLLAGDMWTGWGIRTLSTKNPAYNPFSFQRGSVWPHDNGICAAGMKRYGFAEQANQVAKGILDAADHFLSYRLPEVFAGIDREPSSFPAQYRGANIPQAWAAGSVFHFIQTMLGLEADAPNGRLWVNPQLPDWLPSLSLSGLKVGKTTLTLDFWREGIQTAFALKSLQGPRLEVKRSEDSGGTEPRG